MIYNIKRVDEDTVHHELIKKDGTIILIGKEVGISKLEKLQEHFQDWVNQRKTIFKLSSVTNNLGLKLRLK